MKNKKYSKKAVLKLCALTLVSFLLTSLSSSADAGYLDMPYADEIRLIVGDLHSIPVNNLRRISLTDPSVADIVDVEEEELLLIAQRSGQTVLLLWEGEGKRAIRVFVVSQDLDVTKERLKELLQTAEIYTVKVMVSEKEGKLLVSGEIPKAKEEDFDKVIAPFEEEIVLLAKPESVDDQVQVDMQIVEINRNELRTLGIAWNTDAITYTEELPSFDGSVEDLFKWGKFTRTSPTLIATVNALASEGKAKVLSQPKLVVKSGENATFLVGGEIPIKSTTLDGGQAVESISYKSYGVGMTVVPTIDRGKIDITMNIEISSVDQETIALDDEVAFTTKSASTRLYLEDGETIVLAGLIKNDTADSVARVPGLSKIPVLGAFFRKRATPKKEEEVVISLTPRILKSKKEPIPSIGSQAAKDTQKPKISSYRSGIPKGMREYVNSVQEQISRAISFPEVAQQYGWEGTVKISMLILNDGTLAFAMVKESSGHDVLDDVALNTAQKVAPFDSFPSEADLQELNITIPIIYSQKN